MIIINKSNKKKFSINLHKFSINQVHQALLVAFVFACVFIPEDTFYIKKTTFAILILLNYSLLSSFKTKDENMVFFFSILLTTICIILSIILTGEFVANFLTGFSGYMLMLYMIVKKRKMYFVTIFEKLLFLLALLTLSMGLLDVLGIIPRASNPLLMWYKNSGNAQIGRGNHLAIFYTLYIKTTPLLFVLIPKFVKEKKIICLIITIGALIITGARANIFLAFVILFFCILFDSKNINTRLFLIIFFVIISAFLLINTGLIDLIVSINARKVDSDLVRLGHLKGLYDYWRSNPLRIITGSGFSSTFFSYGSMAYISSMELSYWNLLRQVGIIPFIAIVYMFIQPIGVLIKQGESTLAFSYAMYLVGAYMNPLLYTSTGFILLIYIYCKCYLRDDKNRLQDDLEKNYDYNSSYRFLY